MHSPEHSAQRGSFQAYISEVDQRFQQADSEISHAKKGSLLSRGVRKIRGQDEKQDSDLRIVLTSLGTELKKVAESARSAPQGKDKQLIADARDQLLQSVASVTNYKKLGEQERAFIDRIINVPVWSAEPSEGRAEVRGAERSVQLGKADKSHYDLGTGAYRKGAASKLAELGELSDELSRISQNESSASSGDRSSILEDQLSHVDLSGYQDITGEELEGVPKLSQMRTLDLSRSKLPTNAADALANLWYHHTGLEALQITDSPGLMDNHLKRLSVKFQEGGVLNLAGCTGLTSQSAKYLADRVKKDEIGTQEQGKRFTLIVPMLISDKTASEEQRASVKELIADFRTAFDGLQDKVQLKFVENAAQSPHEAVDLEPRYLPKQYRSS